MDFTKALAALIDGFEAEKVRYALIGGVALGLLGRARATLDIDLLVHKDDLGAAERLMGRLGYKKAFSTENVSQYEHGDIPASRVDFVHAFREISLSMLRRAKNAAILKGKTARVAAAEDVIGLKVQSMANDPNRKSGDLADIEALMELRGGELDWELVSEYFMLFGMKDILGDLKRRFGGDH